jgi:germacradienol/geosmin synthase
VQQAVDIVNDLVTSRLRQFEHIISTELPLLVHEMGLGETERAALYGLCGALRSWIAGDTRWEQTSGRYHPSRRERATQRQHGASPRGASPGTALGPAGLGTAAARLASLAGAGHAGE